MCLHSKASDFKCLMLNLLFGALNLKRRRYEELLLVNPVGMVSNEHSVSE